MTQAPLSTANARLRERYAAAVMPNYGVPPVALASGEGCRVFDVDGRSYLDMLGGIAVSALGHNHPALVRAVSRQVATLAHTSNLFLHEPEVALAERLLKLAGAESSASGRVFFANSGTEANEAALKVVRRGASPGRDYVVAAENGFHGRTMGALALTGKPAIREPFAPYGVDVRFVPYGDTFAMRREVTDRCAAVFLEPTQGEAGVVPAPPGYLAAVRELCDATGTPLVLDEIQSGIGRTGAWFAHQHEGVRPDIITVAKGLGGGLPIGACIGLGRYGSVLAAGDHGATFGGNPVACAGALAVLDTIDAHGLLTHAREAGDALAADIGGIHHPLLAGVRGSGLWRALLLSSNVSAEVEMAARGAGFLVNAVAPAAIRLAPPLVITATEIQEFVAALPGILDAVHGASGDNAPGGKSASDGRARGGHQ